MTPEQIKCVIGEGDIIPCSVCIDGRRTKSLCPPSDVVGSVLMSRIVCVSRDIELTLGRTWIQASELAVLKCSPGSLRKWRAQSDTAMGVLRAVYKI